MTALTPTETALLPYPAKEAGQAAQITWLNEHLPWTSDGSTHFRPINSNQQWTSSASRQLWGESWAKLAHLMADDSLNEIQVQAVSDDPTMLAVISQGPRGVLMHPDLTMPSQDLIEGLSAIVSKALRGKGVRGAKGLTPSNDLECIITANLDDGPRESRLTAVVPPASDAPALAIRRFPVSALPLEVVVGEESLNIAVSPKAWPGVPLPEKPHPLEKLFERSETEAPLRPWASCPYRALYWLLAQFEYFERNIFCYGPTYSGKTTMLQTLIFQTDHNDRILAIEKNAHELFLPHLNRVSLFTTDERTDPKRTPELINEAVLRFTPEIIAYGELRGPEAYSAIQASISGHRLLTTVHASSPPKLVGRLMGMSQSGAPSGSSANTIARDVHNSANLLVQVRRIPYKVDGKIRKVRRVCAIHELVMDEHENPHYVEIFTTTLNEHGEPCLVWTGNPGSLLESLEHDHLPVPEWMKRRSD
jgi:Flp pilus assembly CpaF family ATPase